MTRSSPIRHNVRASNRKGRSVTSFNRGSGSRIGNPHFTEYNPPQLAVPQTELPDENYGALRDLHESLRAKGYSYKEKKGTSLIYTKNVGDNKFVIVMRLVHEGEPAKKVNIRISPNLVQTRQHGTPALYDLDNYVERI